MTTTYEGWLSKKKQKRYFILKDGVLYWFANQQESNVDLASLARGSIKVSTCTIEIIADKQTIELKGPVDTVDMKAKSDEEMNQWVEKLKQAIEESKKKNEEMGRMLKTGWLEKKGQKRFFVLKGDTLEWYLNEQAGKPKGVLDLKQCIVGPVSPQGVFVISAPYLDNAQYKLSAPGGVHDAKAWAKAITDAVDSFKSNTTVKEPEVTEDIAKDGWLEKKGKRRYFKLNNFLLTWYDADPKAKDVQMNGSLNLQNCTVAHVNFAFTIKPSVGASYTLKASTVQDAEEWVNTIRKVTRKRDTTDTKISFQAASKREGWVVRVQLGKSSIVESAVGAMVNKMRKTANDPNQDRRRYLRIDAENADLKYYTTDTSTATPKATMHLAGCRVLQLDDHSFMVRTSHGKDFPFSCESPADLSEWTQSIQFFINKANTEMEKAVSRHGWLNWESGLTPEVQGRLQAISSKANQVLSGERWVVLTKDNFLLWFTHVVNPASITIDKAAAYCELPSCTIEVKSDRKQAFVICTPRPEKITFTARSEDEYTKWYQTIKGIIDGKQAHLSDDDEGGGLVFGVPLEELLQREGTQIPKIVTQCVDYIQNNGKDVTGIFRLSGQAGQIKQYAGVFDAGEVVTFQNEDVHCVTGLLKSFLRQMPEPIFSFDLYPQFLQSATSIEQLRGCIAKIPPARLPLIKFLMRFLCEMSLCVSLTSMDVPNIAIVFGPNILRRKEDDPGAAMAETPLVLKAIQMMITHYATLFDDQTPLPPPPTTRKVNPAIPSTPPPPSGIPPPPSGPPADLPPGPLGELPDDDEDF